MKLATTMVAVGSEMIVCDTLEYEGVLWLVPAWLEDDSGRWSTPKRAIRMTGLQYQVNTSPVFPTEYVLNGPIPKDVFEGRAPPEESGSFVVKDYPTGLAYVSPIGRR